MQSPVVELVTELQELQAQREKLMEDLDKTLKTRPAARDGGGQQQRQKQPQQQQRRVAERRRKRK